MCVIVDINIAKRVLIDKNDKDYNRLQEAIYSKTRIPAVKITYGGKLTKEYEKVHSIYQIILTLDRAGKAHQTDDLKVEAETNNLLRNSSCKSDDEHILALAIISGVRILTSSDKNLISDFKDSNLINTPRGSVYSSNNHLPMLNRLCK